MASTDQSQAIQIANNIIGASQQVMALFVQLTQVQQHWTDVNAGAVIGALATAAQNTDGSLGTPDPSPNSNNPIDTGVHPTMSRAVSSTEISQMKTILDGLVSYINGQAVTTQPGAHAILNVAVGG